MIRNEIKNRKLDFMNDAELISLKVGSVMLFDVECFPNYFLILFKSIDNQKYLAFEMSEWSQIDYRKLAWVLWRFTLIGFNSNSYDLPMVTACLKKYTTSQLKDISNDIIYSELRRYDFEKNYNVKVSNYNHVDLIEVAPLKGSLKLYGARLHSPTIQDLPFPDTKELTKVECEIVKSYCGNDNDNNELLFRKLVSQLDLRYKMSKQYGLDLRSKSDAQIAEAVLNAELERLTGKRPKRPVLKDTNFIKYNVPDFIKFETKELQRVLEIVRNCKFTLDNSGSPKEPAELKELIASIGNSIYNLGMGGLHSKEKCISYKATADMMLTDNDVESYYPNIILNQNLYPSHLGSAFLEIYDTIVKTRIKAKQKIKELKKQGKKEDLKEYQTIADSLKITINGSFGKFGSKWSTLYSPQLLLQVTITGQLSLLMLIEKLETNGISVVSGNTDGIVSYYHKSRHKKMRQLIKEWEALTNFKTEETIYSAIYSRDVNNYIAFKENESEPKLKGAFSGIKPDLSKNPNASVCLDAMIEYIRDGKSIERTIKECKDIRKFVVVRNVKGGAHKKGRTLGKTIRWYYGKNCPGTINYSTNNNKVSLTEGAKPLMVLPAELPTDIDYNWYIENTISLLKSCGGIDVSKQLRLF